MNNQPWQPTATIENLQQRAKIINQIRDFFQQRQLLEVETPLLSAFSVTDLQLATFKTAFLSPQQQNNQTLYLITSPEYHMKRLLAAGSGAIFQICKVFRNEEQGRKHNPEFTMLEWYRPNFSMWQLIDEIDELLQLILATQPTTHISYQQAFIEYLSIDPLNISQIELAKIATDYGFISAKNSDIDTLLQFLFSEVIEPKIGQQAPVAVYNFPRSQAALARVNPQDLRVAERFEIYYQGIELANGFAELTDPIEQQARFQDDNQQRQLLGLPVLAIDQYFIQALQSGMPDCAGVALGLDRLIMLALKQNSVADVLSFSIDNA